MLSRFRPVFKRRTRPGAAPGAVVVDREAPLPTINLIQYSSEECREEEITDLEALVDRPDSSHVTWINVNGLGDAETIHKLGEIFGLHPLALEDVVNVHQRPKVEDYDETLFIVARMAELRERHLETEQISLFLGRDFLLTFQERPGDCLDKVRRRLRKSRGQFRRSGPDYLAYAILDTIIDAYFPIVEAYGERLDVLEDELARRLRRETLARVQGVRSDLQLLRRTVWGHREFTDRLLREPYSLIHDETRLFLRDCYDHTVQLIEVAEIDREQCSELRDFYMSSLSHRTNEIMRVLTIIATIFIPLSFIAGVYGMNFSPERSPWNMPELEWTYGYPFALGIMLAVAAALLAYFWRKGWLRP